LYILSLHQYYLCSFAK